ASALEQRGHRVLLVDLDPQADATSTVGIRPHTEHGPTSFDYVLGKCQLGDAVRPTGFGALDILPSYDAAIDRIGVPISPEPDRGRALAIGFHLRFARELALACPRDPE